MTHLRPALDLFGASQRYVIPIHQRRDVWTKNRQWAPLWQDVRSRAEKVLACSRTLVSPVPLLPMASPSDSASSVLGRSRTFWNRRAHQSFTLGAA